MSRPRSDASRFLCAQVAEQVVTTAPCQPPEADPTGLLETLAGDNSQGGNMQKKATALLATTGVAGLLAGGVMMTSLSASAADSGGSGTGTSSYGAPNGTAPDGTAADNHSNGNTDPTKPMRDDEELLTGDTLAKVTAAVKARYPDATFQRVETDSDGVYEAHILVDGKPVTVEVDKRFAITGTESAPSGGQKPSGQAPDGEAPAA